MPEDKILFLINFMTHAKLYNKNIYLCLRCLIIWFITPLPFFSVMLFSFVRFFKVFSSKTRSCLYSWEIFSFLDFFCLCFWSIFIWRETQICLWIFPSKITLSHFQLIINFQGFFSSILQHSHKRFFFHLIKTYSQSLSA